MGTPLRVIDRPDDPYRTEVGDCWRLPANDEADRECWVIHLPNGVFWQTTHRTTDGDQWWEISGTPPNLTVSPSINAEGRWHGHIANGEITD